MSRVINPLSSAPYRLRILDDAFPAAGAIVVEWHYRFSRNEYETVIKRVAADGPIRERHVSTGDHSIRAGLWDTDRAVEIAESIIDCYRQDAEDEAVDARAAS